MSAPTDAVLVEELLAAGTRALERGVDPEIVAASQGEVFAAFAAAAEVSAGALQGAVMVQAFCDGAFRACRARARTLREEAR